MHIYGDDGLIAHVVVNTYVTWARRYVTWAGMSMFVMVGGEQEGDLARYLNVEIMQIICNKLQFGRRLLGSCVNAKRL